MIYAKKYKTTKSHFHKALRKYGQENFEWAVLYESNDEDFCLNIMEPYMIRCHDSFKNGYNMTSGGEGSLDRKCSLETKLKQKNTMKNLYETTDLRQKIKNGTKEGMKKWWNSLSENEKHEYHKKLQNRNPSFLGKKHSLESKNKMSSSHLGKTMSKSMKEKTSKRMIGNKCAAGNTMEKNNGMRTKKNRDKVANSKIGRKRFNLPNGSFLYIYPEEFAKYNEIYYPSSSLLDKINGL